MIHDNCIALGFGFSAILPMRDFLGVGIWAG
jgi:hypothetical protein